MYAEHDARICLVYPFFLQLSGKAQGTMHMCSSGTEESPVYYESWRALCDPGCQAPTRDNNTLYLVPMFCNSEGDIHDSTLLY